jgi:hypothetical protein
MDLAVLAIRDGFNVRRDSAIQPTMAGYALFGIHPEALRPAWRVTALRLAGRDRTSPVAEQLDTEGPAPQAIAQVEAFLHRNLQPASPSELEAPESVGGRARRVVNALAHRDYATPSQVFVRILTIGWRSKPPAMLPGMVLGNCWRTAVARAIGDRRGCSEWALWRLRDAGWG